MHVSPPGSVGTYWNDHSAIWHDNSSGPSGSWECSASTHGPRSPPGDHPAKCIPAAAVGAGTCYYLDSTASNSWRALRIMNDTANWQYVEYDPTFDFKHITLHELYDLSADPFQVGCRCLGVAVCCVARFHRRRACVVASPAPQHLQHNIFRRKVVFGCVLGVVLRVQGHRLHAVQLPVKHAHWRIITETYVIDGQWR